LRAAVHGHRLLGHAGRDPAGAWHLLLWQVRPPPRPDWPCAHAHPHVHGGYRRVRLEPVRQCMVLSAPGCVRLCATARPPPWPANTHHCSLSPGSVSLCAALRACGRLWQWRASQTGSGVAGACCGGARIAARCPARRPRLAAPPWSPRRSLWSCSPVRWRGWDRLHARHAA